MSYQNTAVRDRPDVVQQLHSLHSPPGRVGLADRLSLRLGLWLLVRSVEHVQQHADREVHALRLRAERDREARERAYERSRLQWLSR